MSAKLKLRLQLASLVIGVQAAFGAPGLTTVNDVLYKADGTRFEGVATIHWRGFRAGDGTEVPEHELTVRVANGSLKVSLIPTTNALDTAYYTVKFASSGRTQFVEYWSVRPSSSALRLAEVRTASPILGEIVAPVSVVGISDVLGLRSELDAKLVKGAAFVNGRMARINNNGQIEAATGAATDCIRVDGSSGPCGNGGGSSNMIYVDGDIPTGALNGSNNVFSLSAAPAPAAGLNLFRNGVLLRTGTDFTLSGNIVTLSGPAPVSSDSLQAWYRITNGTPETNFVDGETPAGSIDGTNLVFTLSASPMPASSLRLYRNGLLQKPGEDFDITTNAVTFRSVSRPQPGDIIQAFFRR